VEPELASLTAKLGDKPFFGGDAPGYGEAFIWHNIDNILVLKKAKGLEIEMEKLTAYHARFAELPGIKDYLATRSKTWGVPGSILHDATK